MGSMLITSMPDEPRKAKPQCDRHMWDVFHGAVREGRIDLPELYREYNYDNHIETAMRRILVVAAA